MCVAEAGSCGPCWLPQRSYSCAHTAAALPLPLPLPYRITCCHRGCRSPRPARGHLLERLCKQLPAHPNPFNPAGPHPAAPGCSLTRPTPCQDDGTAVAMAAGFVGQENAREAAGIVVEMIRCVLCTFVVLLLLAVVACCCCCSAVAVSPAMRIAVEMIRCGLSIPQHNTAQHSGPSTAPVLRLARSLAGKPGLAATGAAAELPRAACILAWACSSACAAKRHAPAALRPQAEEVCWARAAADGCARHRQDGTGPGHCSGAGHQGTWHAVLTGLLGTRRCF